MTVEKEEAGVVQAETKIEQEEINEDIPAFVTGFGEDEEVDILLENDESSEEKESPTDGEEKSVEKETQDGKELKTDSTEEVNNKVKKLESHIVGLNKALHEARQNVKEHKEVAETPPLTQQQLRQMFNEHKDDPEVLYNLVEYMTNQAAKKGTDDAVDATELSRKKAEHDKIVRSHWPDLDIPTSELRTQTDQIKRTLDIGEHPFGDYMAMGAMIIDQLPKITQDAYEKGKAEALKDKTNNQRQADIKQDKLTPSGKKVAKSDDLSDNFKATAKQMGLTSAQQKIYARLVKKPKK